MMKRFEQNCCWPYSPVSQCSNGNLILIFSPLTVWCKNQHIGWIMSRANCNRIRIDQCYLQGIYINHKEIWRGESLKKWRMEEIYRSFWSHCYSPWLLWRFRYMFTWKKRFFCRNLQKKKKIIGNLSRNLVVNLV